MIIDIIDQSFYVLSFLDVALPGVSLTFEVEGYWLVSRQVPCKSEGRRPEPLGGSGGMLPWKIFRTFKKVSQGTLSCNVGKKSSFCNHSYLT